MNRHLKVAFFVAPFLLIGGYIVADHFQAAREQDYRAATYAVHELRADSTCELVREKCLLHSDNLVLDVFVAGDRYRVVSSRKLDNVAMALAQDDRETRVVAMMPHEGQRQWSTVVRKLTNLEKEKPLLLRVVATGGKDQYYAEVPIDSTGPWN